MAATAATMLVFDKSEYHSDILVSEFGKINAEISISLAHNTSELITKLHDDKYNFVVLFDPESTLSVSDITGNLPDQNKPFLFVITENYDREKALELINNGAHNTYTHNELNNLILEVIRLSALIKKTDLVNEQRQNIRLAQERFQTLITQIPTPVAYTHQGGLVNINPAFSSYFKLANVDEIAETSILDLIDDNDKDKVKSLLNQLEKDERIKQGHLKNIIVLDHNRKPQEVELLFHKTTLNSEDCIQVIVKPTTKTVSDQQPIIKNASQTQSFSPEYFIQKLNQAIKQNSSEQTAALSLIEAADYHRIKKNLGITRAERIMHQVHEMLMSFNNENTLMTQAGTDVYYLLIKGPNREACLKTIDSIRSKFRQHHFKMEEHSVLMPLNIGLVHLENNINSSEQAFSLADVACTVARNRKDGEIHIYNPEQDRSTVETLDQNWGNSIRDAIKNNNFKLVFQPIIGLKVPGVANYEVLLRMKSSTGNDILPNQFLHAAKQSDLEIDIDRWVISNALNTLDTTNQQDTTVFIKLSEGSLRSIDFFNWLQRLDSRDKQRMVLEISEELAIQWPSETLNLLQERQHSGFQVCIEQFGNHPEAENDLFDLNADYYKVDGAFSNHLSTNRKHQSVIHKISLSTKGRNIKTIACFVQDADSLAILWQEGFDFIQGNYLQIPKTKLDYQFDSLI